MSNKHSATKVESHGLLHDQKIRRITGDVFAHLFLAILAVIWLVPIVWVFAESFNKNTAPYTSSFFPKEWTLDNYRVLFTDRNVLDFPKMFGTTFIIACFTCAISLIFVLSVGILHEPYAFPCAQDFHERCADSWHVPGYHGRHRHLLHLEGLGPVKRHHDYRGVDSRVLRRFRRWLLRDEGLYGHHSDLAGRSRPARRLHPFPGVP